MLIVALQVRRGERSQRKRHGMRCCEGGNVFVFLTVALGRRLRGWTMIDDRGALGDAM